MVSEISPGIRGPRRGEGMLVFASQWFSRVLAWASLQAAITPSERS